MRFIFGMPSTRETATLVPSLARLHDTVTSYLSQQDKPFHNQPHTYKNCPSRHDARNVCLYGIVSQQHPHHPVPVPSRPVLLLLHLGKLALSPVVARSPTRQAEICTSHRQLVPQGRRHPQSCGCEAVMDLSWGASC